MAEEVGGVSPFGIGVYPKAHVLNRFISKFIDFLIIAAANELVSPVGFLAGLAYVLVADGFAGGRSIGKRLIGLQTVVPRTREAAGFKESIIRNLPFAAAQLASAIPWVGWIVSGAVIGFESLLVLGNEQGRRLGDEVAQTQVLDVGHLALPD